MFLGMENLLKLVTALWRCTSSRIVLLTKLISRVESLAREIKRLEDIYEDVTIKVTQEEEQRMRHRRLKEVERWLEETRLLILEAMWIMERGKQEVPSRCLWGRCPKNPLSRYRVAIKVDKMLVKVKEARERGRFETLTYELPYPLVEKRPLENPVGLDLIFQEAWRWINDKYIRIVGLYGVGGVGKTTLLTKINNELIRYPSKLVIWVTVKKPASVESVQEIIHNWLNLKDDNWDRKTIDEKATVIRMSLSGKPFVLLLDDLWERLELSKVGIPLPDSGNIMVKVVFTTRSQDVCRQMGAQKLIEVNCLGPSEAKALFNEKVGERALNSHPEIQQLAEEIAEYCGGLPIALITIGRAMSDKTNPEEWRRAKRVLGSSRSRIPSMSSDVYPVLKLSYDSLSNETIKQCFLYCALFPEGYEIPRENLIICWIDEGILHEYRYISTEAIDQGSEIIESLKSACLLETGTEWEDSVKMHDVIRDMALWIARQEGRNWDKGRIEQEISLINMRRTGAMIRKELGFPDFWPGMNLMNPDLVSLQHRHPPNWVPFQHHHPPNWVPFQQHHPDWPSLFPMRDRNLLHIQHPNLDV